MKFSPIVLLALLSCILIHQTSSMVAYHQSHPGMMRGNSMMGFNAPPSPYGVPQPRSGIPHVHVGFMSPGMFAYGPSRPMPGRSPYGGQAPQMNMPGHMYGTGYRGMPTGQMYGSCSGGNCGYWGGCHSGQCGVFYDFRPCHSAECLDGPVHGFECYDGYCQRVCNDGVCRDFVQRGCSGKNCRDDDEEGGADEKRSEDKS